MSQGRDLLLSVSDDNTSSGNPLTVELQGDLTITPGKSVATTVYKNGQTSAQNDAGKSVSLTMGLQAPAGAAQVLMLALNDSGADSYFWITNAVTGGIEFEFTGKVAIQTLNSPTNNDNSMSIQIGIVGDWIRGIAA